jgi:hypothetical protein
MREDVRMRRESVRRNVGAGKGVAAELWSASTERNTTDASEVWAWGARMGARRQYRRLSRSVCVYGIVNGIETD